MPYEISEPQANAILINLSGELSISEIADVNQDAVSQFLTDEHGSYYIIYEVSELKKFPTDISSLKKASEPIATHKGVKYQLITGLQSPIFSFLVNIIGQLFRQNLKKTNTIEEALEYIEGLKAKN